MILDTVIIAIFIKCELGHRDKILKGTKVQGSCLKSIDIYTLHTVNRSRHKVKYDTQCDKVASSDGQ
jgi:hypothetical protein